jgi:hypothetical protein
MHTFIGKNTHGRTLKCRLTYVFIKNVRPDLSPPEGPILPQTELFIVHVSSEGERFPGFDPRLVCVRGGPARCQEVRSQSYDRELQRQRCKFLLRHG